MIRLCIFDLDGTLSNTLDSLYYYCNAALRRCGFPPVEDKDAVRYMVGRGISALLRDLIRSSLGDSFTEEQLALLQETYESLYSTDPMHLVTEYDGVRSMLHALQEDGVMLAVFSNKPDAMTKEVVRSLYPEISFSICLGKCDAFPRKPAPDGALWIMEQLGVEKAETLYIGDSETDMETGRNAGLQTVGVTWGFRSAEELRQSGGRQIVDAPAEILAIVHNTNDL